MELIVLKSSHQRFFLYNSRLEPFTTHSIQSLAFFPLFFETSFGVIKRAAYFLSVAFAKSRTYVAFFLEEILLLHVNFIYHVFSG